MKREQKSQTISYTSKPGEKRRLNKIIFRLITSLKRIGKEGTIKRYKNVKIA